MRPLTFHDGGGDERKWLPGGAQTALEALQEFVDEHEGDTSVSIKGEDDEALVFSFGAGSISRTKGARTEYRLVTNRGDYRTQLANFARGGFAALDRHGPWLPDVPGLERARLRFEFDGSVLRRTHPRELRRRLAVLTYASGREPVSVDGVTHCGFGTVDSWFADDGRGLVVTFDPASALVDAAGLYDGVPADLLGLVPHGSSVPATGVFTFSGPCAMAEGLVSRLQEAGLGVEDTGVGLLEGFLAMEDFTPAAVAEAVEGWRAEDVARGFAAVAEPARAALDPGAVTSFCRIWADSGYNDRWDVHYVFFDGDAVEDVGEERDELLGLVRALGLERVDGPPGAGSGEVWVRTDPRVDAELARWS
ncbi:DUF6357 family protein [Saccharothrix obliqua]|uniref:DUF6357 family protein n=1 Tax=Saccharothrix obliqua TaxID=2861747 RepID=UPI001C5E0F86|nr:hypothetical protein [Saccharothrix obliqua]